LFTCDSLGVSGAELVVLDLMKNLDKRKFSAIVYCHEKNQAMTGRVKALGLNYLATSNFPQPGPTGRSGIHPYKIFCYLVALTKIGIELCAYVKKKKIDVIYANAYPNCLYAMVPALISRVPLIWHVHNIRKIRTTNWLIYRIAGLVCSKIITVSKACKINLLKANINLSKIETIYNGIDLKKFVSHRDRQVVRAEIGVKPGTAVIGMFGQPIPQKGHQYFIDACPLVLKEYQKCIFIIVGYLFDSEYQKYLYRQVERLGLKPKIRFLGWREDIPELMEAIDILVHPCIYAEPAGLVLMEAMTMGKPIVATATGGIPELVRDRVDGFLVPPKDAQSLAKAILRLLKCPQMARVMGKMGREKVERQFTLESQIRSIEEMIETC